MSWDYPIHSFTQPDVEPQTPTRTPTSGPFDTSFQTPKIESSFYDPRVTWDTANPYGSSPGLTRLSERPEPPSPSPQRGRIPGEGGNRLKRHSLVEGDSKGRILNHPPGLGIEGGDGDINDLSKRSAASMQTPPPTRTSRRKVQDRDETPRLPGEPAAAATPVQQSYSTNLETPSRLIGLSPNLFGLQDSPGFFRAAGNSTSDSPFLQRYQMPWDQGAELPSSTTADMPDSYMHSFDASTQLYDDIFDIDPAGDTGLETPRLPTTRRSIGRNRGGNLSVPHDPHSFDVDQDRAFHSSFSTSPRLPIPQNEDPSMFLSSPARRFGYSDTALTPIAPRLETRQPYHYQTEESERDRREKELRKLQRARSIGQRHQALREEYPPPITLPKSGRPAAKRSATYSGTPVHGRNFSQNSLSSGTASISGVRKTPSKGRSSPLKSQRTPYSRPVSASLAAPMESLVLKIGKDGRAKTEMKMASDSMSGDALTDSDSDTSEMSDYPMVKSQNPSFNFPEITPRRLSLAQTHSRPLSKSSSHSSTAASSLSGRQSSWADSSRGRGRPLRLASPQKNWNEPRSHSVNTVAYQSREPSVTDSDATQDENDGTGDAQHALKQVLQSRKRSSVPQRPVPLSSVSRTSQSLAMATLRSSPPPYVNCSDSYTGSTSSPTTITDPGISTPTAERQSNPSTGTRCVCNSMNNGGHLMIQCESCTHWLHTKCVGLDRQSLPPVYICIYCTQSPIRQGRVRDPLSKARHASSPLTRKSFGYR